MKWAVAPKGERITAYPDATGTCPACTAAVIPKCGDELQWHWAHIVGESIDCELGEGIDPDEFTGWHISLQTHAAQLGATIEYTHPTLKRKADIRTPAGTVIELQHSRIDPDVVHGREDDWLPIGPMIWLWDAAEWHKDWDRKRPGKLVEVPTKPLVVGHTPIFLDCAQTGLFQITAINRRQNRYAVRVAELNLTGLDFIEQMVTGDVPPSWMKPPTKADNVRRAATSKQPERPRYCTAPSFADTFSGDKCGLTATDGSDLCWAHLETRLLENRQAI